MSDAYFRSSPSRALKASIAKSHQKTIREYSQSWEEALGAEGKPWTWRDVSRQIEWGHFGSMQRVFVMMGEVKGRLEKGRVEEAEAVLVQCMEATHQLVFRSDRI